MYLARFYISIKYFVYFIRFRRCVTNAGDLLHFGENKDLFILNVAVVYVKYSIILNKKKDFVRFLFIYLFFKMKWTRMRNDIDFYLIYFLLYSGILLFEHNDRLGCCTSIFLVKRPTTKRSYTKYRTTRNENVSIYQHARTLLVAFESAYARSIC